MYGIFTYIHPHNQPNVDKYTIHGWYGLAIVYDTSINARILDGIRMLNVCWGKVILLRADSTILFLVVWWRFFLPFAMTFPNSNMELKNWNGKQDVPSTPDVLDNVSKVCTESCTQIVFDENGPTQRHHVSKCSPLCGSILCYCVCILLQQLLGHSFNDHWFSSLYRNYGYGPAFRCKMAGLTHVWSNLSRL